MLHGVKCNLVSVVGAILVFVAAACGTTNNYDTGGGTSAAGQSCTRTFDCASGLVCLNNTCYASAAPVTGDASTDGAAAEAAASGPHLGLVKESCQTTADCQAPLECVGNTCSVVTYNLTATGKSCSGECSAAPDCCELPVDYEPELGTWYSLPDAGYGYGAAHPTLEGEGVRCQDLLAYLGGDATICSAASFPTELQSELARGCSIYAAYCQCAANTWTCTNNMCVYSAPCTTATSTSASASQCPGETRTGRALGTTCNASAPGGTGTCQAAGCTADSDCNGTYPSGAERACNQPDGGTGDCICYQSACYFSCSQDTDCAAGSTCDTTTQLCASAGCSTNDDCILTTGSPLAQCSNKQCHVACQTDIDCSPPSSICSGGFCTPSGCASDTDCTGDTYTFCVTAAAASTYTSAVTN